VRALAAFSGYDVNASEADAYPPLHAAIVSASKRCNLGTWYSRDEAYILVLVAAGADVNLLAAGPDDTEPTTPLQLAVDLRRSHGVIETLVQAGANVNVWDGYGDTPLHVAVEHGAWDEVDTFLEAGADIHATDACGMTPLQLAVEEQQMRRTYWHRIVASLVAAGADPTSVPTDRQFVIQHAHDKRHW
jgi:ankyrin repeat protein